MKIMNEFFHPFSTWHSFDKLIYIRDCLSLIFFPFFLKKNFHTHPNVCIIIIWLYMYTIYILVYVYVHRAVFMLISRSTYYGKSIYYKCISMYTQQCSIMSSSDYYYYVIYILYTDLHIVQTLLSL